MKTPEILAPAGGREQLTAAVRCGADAVYLGAPDFNARRGAENFTDADLREAVRLCHERGVKVYVTLNTLVFDRELPALYATAKTVAEAGADAVLVQDFAVARALRELCPDLPLHASTQMAVHNAAGAELLAKEGLTRVVLARELSLDEIREIRRRTSVELEVFVHGAHCMAASGNCYLSAALGERSGNRGLCAQPCRLDWKSRTGRPFALSLKDMSLLDHAAELCEAGVDSLKIEGRLKRPEYVAAAVTALRRALAGERYDKATLQNVFSRGGFTDGYLLGKRDLTMFGTRTRDDAADPSVLKTLAESYKNETHPRTVDFTLRLTAGAPAVLTAESGERSVTVTGDAGETPRTAPLAREIALRSLSKLGGTPFSVGDLTFENPDGLTLSAASLNDLRRRAAEELAAALTAHDRTIHEAKPPVFAAHAPAAVPAVRVRLERLSQYSDALAGCDALILPIDEILARPDEVKRLPVPVTAELPELVYPGREDALRGQLREIKKLGIRDGLAGNLGTLALLKEEGFTVHGGHGLNAANTPALAAYGALGAADMTLSTELTAKAIGALGGDLPRGVLVYGRLPLMWMRACPQKSETGCGDCAGVSFLTDRRGVRFPVLCREKRYSALLNSVPLYAADKALPPVDFITLYFTTEEAADCAAVYRKVTAHEPFGGDHTTGLFFRTLR